MIDRWIVFGGWAVETEILRPLFGDCADLIDTLEVVPAIVRDDLLLPEWKEIVARLVATRLPDRPFGIAGWSTGALLAWAAAEAIIPDCVVCLSATPSFCRRPGFPLGQRMSTLRSMREAIAADAESALDAFYRQCGIDSQRAHRSGRVFLPSALIAGLHFLEQATLLPTVAAPYPALFLHGSRDAIIPPGAGRYFSVTTGGVYSEYDGPHGFFIERHSELRSRIEHFSRVLDT